MVPPPSEIEPNSLTRGRDRSECCHIGHISCRYWFAPSIVVSVAMLAGSSAWAGPPFVTDDPDTPDKGHFEINLAAQYTHFLGGSVASVPSLEVNYGVLGNLEATVLVPMNLSQVGGVGTNVGFGDVEVSLKDRLVEEDAWGWRPAIAIAPQINLPSGSEPRGLGAGRVAGFIPVWLQRTSISGPCLAGAAPTSILVRTKRTGASQASLCCVS